jgi:hypothetical protein
VSGHLLLGAAIDDDGLFGPHPDRRAGSIHGGVAAAVDGDPAADLRFLAGRDIAQEVDRVHHLAGVHAGDLDPL